MVHALSVRKAWVSLDCFEESTARDLLRFQKEAMIEFDRMRAALEKTAGIADKGLETAETALVTANEAKASAGAGKATAEAAEMPH